MVQYFLSFTLDLKSTCSKGLLLIFVKNSSGNILCLSFSKIFIHNALQYKAINLLINSLWKGKLTSIEGEPKKNM